MPNLATEPPPALLPMLPPLLAPPPVSPSPPLTPALPPGPSALSTPHPASSPPPAPCLNPIKPGSGPLLQSSTHLTPSLTAHTPPADANATQQSMLACFIPLIAAVGAEDVL
ncbi:hypothetical protein C0993_006988, partial [Termitomyces sp. T159_Od127]